VVQLGDKPQTLATNDLGETILGCMAISGGAILVGASGTLMALMA
jgi:hypothetical protein